MRYVVALLSTEFGSEHQLALLKQAGIEPLQIRDFGSRVSATQYALLLQVLWQNKRDESFGFTAHPLKPGTFATMCQALITCGQLEHALRRAAKFYYLVSDDFEFKIERHKMGARFELRLKQPLRGALSFFTEAVFAVFLRLSSWLIDQQITPLGMGFTYPQRMSGHSFEAKIACPISYSQEFSFLDFPLSVLQETIKRNALDLKSMLSHGPQYFLVDFRKDTSFASRIQSLWVQDVESINMSLDSFARSFGLSPSSLRRKLREEGCNFHNLRETIRRQRALYYLLQTHKSIETIAAKMGYSEPSTFHRAFKKWTGFTPRDYRLKSRKSELQPPNERAH